MGPATADFGTHCVPDSWKLTWFNFEIKNKLSGIPRVRCLICGLFDWQLEPEYEAAARTLKEYGIPLAKVDGPREKELADSLKIPGWPALKVFRKGRSVDYKGKRLDYEKRVLEHLTQRWIIT